MGKINRNSPCPCGSGKKYKKCCAISTSTLDSSSASKEKNPPNNLFKEILEPITQCMKFISDETSIANSTIMSIMATEFSPIILQTAFKQVKKSKNKKVSDGIKALIANAPAQAKWAKEQRENDFPVIFSHNLIANWGAFEVCMEDVVVAILINDNEAIKKIYAAGIKYKITSNGSLSEDDARNIYRKMEYKFRKDFDVIGAFEKKLSLFNLNGDIDSDLGATLCKINSIRNCLLHRSGIIDKKAVDQAPSLKPFLDKKVHISRTDFDKYFRTMVDYLSVLFKRIGKLGIATN